MTTAVRTQPHVSMALKYMRDVITGKVLACKWVRLACERNERDLDDFAGKEAPFYFDAAAAERVCSVIEHFPHIKGIWAQHHKRLQLEPWQVFIVCLVFGWKCRADASRRFRVVYTEVPRKNAKSTMTSAIGLYLLACDGEQGGHVVSAANTREQAKLVFVDAQNMARREEGFRQKFGITVLAHTITQQATASKFEALAAEYSNLDGLNISAALIDELHAHQTRGIWDILETAMGSRQQPLMWAITTAGLNRASVCYDQRSHVIDVLSGTVQDESYFGIIFTRDDDDDPYEEETWIKANPNYGVSIYPEQIKMLASRARTMPSAQNAFLTKHLNIWVNADTAWLPAGAWAKCEDDKIGLEDFEHEPCYIGIDLALRSDIAAVVVCFPPAAGRDYWAVFGRYFLPEQTVIRGENSHYQGWESAGQLIATPGAVTDFDYVMETVEDFAARFDILEIAIDPFDAGPLVVGFEKRGLPKPIEIRQSAVNMSPPMIEMEGLVLSQKIHHDGDPVLAWMVSNVVAHRTGELLQPRKDAEDKKIDGVTALLMCLQRGMYRNTAQADYEARGLWSI